VVEHVPSKPEALSLKPSTAKKKKSSIDYSLLLINICIPAPCQLVVLLYLKKEDKAGGVAQAVESLPTQCKALSSNLVPPRGR
jgi:hypothetical protein